jgi:hypothetical protein
MSAHKLRWSCEGLSDMSAAFLASGSLLRTALFHPHPCSGALACPIPLVPPVTSTTLPAPGHRVRLRTLHRSPVLCCRSRHRTGPGRAGLPPPQPIIAIHPALRKLRDAKGAKARFTFEERGVICGRCVVARVHPVHPCRVLPRTSREDLSGELPWKWSLTSQDESFHADFPCCNFSFTVTRDDDLSQLPLHGVSACNKPK